MKPLKRLTNVMQKYQSLTVAVSGGIDSTLLAYLANQVLGARAQMVHAISPAVPAAATKRVKIHARQGDWHLRIVDAGEFGDPRYRANPIDRCYFCKLNLYQTIADLCTGPVASGTNCDDLDDYRPGLTAAREQSVVHPYVEAGLAKRDIYRLAEQLGLQDLAVLPAQPCLASRIETGLYVQQADLEFIEMVEAAMQQYLGSSAALRCRILHQGVVLELDGELLDSSETSEMSKMVASLCIAEKRRFLGVRAYRRGAAFIFEVEA